MKRNDQTEKPTERFQGTATNFSLGAFFCIEIFQILYYAILVNGMKQENGVGKMYKACIFDLDGTLTDTLESITYSVNLTMERMGLPPITMEQCRRFVGNGARKLLECTLRACGDEEMSRMEEAMAVYGDVFAKYCTYHAKPYDGIKEMLERLKKEGVFLAVLSNKPDGQTRDVVRTFFGDHFFDAVQGQKEGIPRKPDPAAVLSILERAGITREECVYIGDSDVDMHTGNNAKVKTVGVSWGFRSKELLYETGAHVVIDHPEELISVVTVQKGKEETHGEI